MRKSHHRKLSRRCDHENKQIQNVFDGIYYSVNERFWTLVWQVVCVTAIIPFFSLRILIPQNFALLTVLHNRTFTYFKSGLVGAPMIYKPIITNKMWGEKEPLTVLCSSSYVLKHISQSRIKEQERLLVWVSGVINQEDKAGGIWQGGVRKYHTQVYHNSSGLLYTSI